MDNAITDLIWIDCLLLCLAVLAMNAKFFMWLKQQCMEKSHSAYFVGKNQ